MLVGAQIAERDLRASRFFTRQVVAHIDDHAVESRAQLARFVEATETLVQAEKRLLHRVLCPLDPAERAQRRAKYYSP
jgi:hypothetical protein